LGKVLMTPTARRKGSLQGQGPKRKIKRCDKTQSSGSNWRGTDKTEGKKVKKRSFRRASTWGGSEKLSGVRRGAFTSVVVRGE